MVMSRSPQLSDRQGFDRRWYARNLQRVYLPQSRIEAADAWNEAIGLGASPGELQVSSGRHCYEGFVYNSETKYLIDTTGLRLHGVDDHAGYYIEPGCGNWDMFRIFNNLYGRTVPAGSCFSVGLGGHIAGGGYGYLSRKYGLTVDHVSAVDIVVKDGNSARLIERVSKENSPDLFWSSLGGGGGNFGIITRYYFENPPVAPTYLYTGMLPISWTSPAITEAVLADLLDAFYQQCVESQKSVEYWPFFEILHCNHQAAGNMVWSMYAFDPPGNAKARSEFSGFFREVCRKRLAEIERIVPVSREPGVVNGHPWHGVVPSLKDTGVRYLTFLEGVQSSSGSGPNRFGKYKSAYMRKGFTPTMVSAIFEGLTTVPEGYDAAEMAQSLISIDSYGCAINVPASTDTPIPQRSSLMKLQYQTYWNNDSRIGQGDLAQEAAHLKWIDDMYAATYSATGGFPDPRKDEDGIVDGCYYNYPDIKLGVNGEADPGIDNAMYLYFKDNYQSSSPFNLQSVKRKWNPEDWFKGSQSIPLS